MLKTRIFLGQDGVRKWRPNKEQFGPLAPLFQLAYTESLVLSDKDKATLHVCARALLKRSVYLMKMILYTSLTRVLKNQRGIFSCMCIIMLRPGHRV